MEDLPIVARVRVPVRGALLHDRPVLEPDVDGRQGVTGNPVDPDGSPLSTSQRCDLASPVLQLFQTRARLGDLLSEGFPLLREPVERFLRLAPA